MIEFTEEDLQMSCAGILLGISAFANYVFSAATSEQLVGERLYDMTPAQIEKLFPTKRLLAAPFATSELSQTMRKIYGFVTTGVFEGSENDLENLLHRMIPLRESWPLRMCVSHTGDLLSTWDRDVQRIDTLLKHFDARLDLMEIHRLTIQQVALLSGLAEKSVRMAANPKNQDPLVTRYDQEEKRTYIDSDEAMRWLSTKRGFKPTVFRAGGEIDASVHSFTQLANLLARRRETLNLAVSDVVSSLQDKKAGALYPDLESGAYSDSLPAWDVTALGELADILAIKPKKDFIRSVSLLIARHSIDSQLQNLE